MTRNGWMVRAAAVLAAASLAASAGAADWAPIKRDGETVREIDLAGVTRNGSVVSFTARHTFADNGEYTVGRRDTKYMMMLSRMDCAKRTLTHVAAEAYDAKMTLISKQSITPQEAPITPGSLDESVFKLLCEGGAKAK